MPHDPVRLADTFAWLKKAHDDLRGAELDLSADPPLIEDALFHAQQAVEKAMKGYLTWKDCPFRKTHDLTEVGRLCSGLDPSLDEICRQAEPLSVFAWTFRYPGEVEEPMAEEAVDALNIAKAVYLAIAERLPKS